MGAGFIGCSRCSEKCGVGAYLKDVAIDLIDPKTISANLIQSVLWAAVPIDRDGLLKTASTELAACVSSQIQSGRLEQHFEEGSRLDEVLAPHIVSTASKLIDDAGQGLAGLEKVNDKYGKSITKAAKDGSAAIVRVFSQSFDSLASAEAARGVALSKVLATLQEPGGVLSVIEEWLDSACNVYLLRVSHESERTQLSSNSFANSCTREVDNYIARLQTKAISSIKGTSEKIASYVSIEILRNQLSGITAMVLKGIGDETLKAREILKTRIGDSSKKIAHAVGTGNSKDVEALEVFDQMKTIISEWLQRVVDVCKNSFSAQIYEFLQSKELRDVAASLLQTVASCVPVVGGAIVMGLSLWRRYSNTPLDDTNSSASKPSCAAQLSYGDSARLQSSVSRLEVIFSQISDLCERDLTFASDLAAAGLDESIPKALNALIGALNGNSEQVLNAKAELDDVVSAVEMSMAVFTAGQTSEIKQLLVDMDARGPAMLIQNEEARKIWKSFAGQAETIQLKTFSVALQHVLGDAANTIDLDAVCALLDEDKNGSIDVLEMDSFFPYGASIEDTIKKLCQDTDARRTQLPEYPPMFHRKKELRAIIRACKADASLETKRSGYLAPLRLVQVFPGRAIPWNELTPWDERTETYVEHLLEQASLVKLDGTLNIFNTGSVISEIGTQARLPASEQPAPPMFNFNQNGYYMNRVVTEAAHEIAHLFSGMVVQIDLCGCDRMKVAIEAIFESLNIQIAGDTFRRKNWIQLLAPLLAKKLGRDAGKPFLLVLVNVEDLYQGCWNVFLNFLVEFARSVETPGGAVSRRPVIILPQVDSLITNSALRNDRADSSNAEEDSLDNLPIEITPELLVPVGAMSREDCIQYLLCSEGMNSMTFWTEVQYSAVRNDLVKEIGCLPLAVQWASLVCSWTHVLPDALVAMLRQKRIDMRKKQKENGIVGFGSQCFDNQSENDVASDVSDAQMKAALESDGDEQRETESSSRCARASPVQHEKHGKQKHETESDQAKFFVLIRVMLDLLGPEKISFLTCLAQIPGDFDTRIAAVLLTRTRTKARNLLWGQECSNFIARAVPAPAILEELVQAGIVAHNCVTNRYKVSRLVRDHILRNWERETVNDCVQTVRESCSFEPKLLKVHKKKEFDLCNFDFGQDRGCVFGKGVTFGRFSKDADAIQVTWKVTKVMQDFAKSDVLCSNAFKWGKHVFYISLEKGSAGNLPRTGAFPHLQAFLRVIHAQGARVGVIAPELGDGDYPLACFQPEMSCGVGIPIWNDGRNMANEQDAELMVIIVRRSLKGFNDPVMQYWGTNVWQLTRPIPSTDVILEYFMWYVEQTDQLPNKQKNKLNRLEARSLDKFNPKRFGPMHGAAMLHERDNQCLFEAKCKLDSFTNDGSTPLLLACRAGNRDLLTELLKYRSATATISWPNCWGDLPLECLHESIDAEMRPLLEEIRETYKGTDEKMDLQVTHTFNPGEMGITYDDRGFVEEIRPDGQACAKRISKGDQIVKIGLEKYSKDAGEKAEKSGLDYEVTFKVRLCAQQFESMRSNGNVSVEQIAPLLTKSNEGGETFLHMVSHKGCAGLVRLILELFKKEDTSSQGKKSKRISNKVPQKPATKLNGLVTAKDLARRTPLHLAADSGHVAVAELLLGADGGDSAVKMQDVHGLTPLMLACRTEKSGCIEVATLLLKTPGASAALEQKSETDWTPLMFACRSGMERIVSIMLEMLKESKSLQNMFQKGRFGYTAKSCATRGSALAKVLSAAEKMHRRQKRTEMIETNL